MAVYSVFEQIGKRIIRCMHPPFSAGGSFHPTCSIGSCRTPSYWRFAAQEVPRSVHPAVMRTKESRWATPAALFQHARPQAGCRKAPTRPQAPLCNPLLPPPPRPARRAARPKPALCRAVQQQAERELAVERARRQEAEARLAAHTQRASENNTALARSNLRLQEQLARLRGEVDVLQHEAGCQRAAATAREREAARKLARTQHQLQRAEEEARALQRQLAGKQV